DAVRELEGAAKLVSDERADDGKPRPLRRAGGDPAAVVRDREHDLAVATAEVDVDAPAAVLERVAEELGEDERERGRAMAGEEHRLELLVDGAAVRDALHQDAAEPPEEIGEVDVVVAALREELVHRGDREDPVHRVLERLSRVDRSGRARLQAQEGRDRLEVVLDTVMDLLG